MTNSDDQCSEPEPRFYEVWWMNLIEFRDRCIFFFYTKTSHFTEELMVELMMQTLLDDMDAPRHPSRDPSRHPYGSYGRLAEWCREKGIKNSCDLSDAPKATPKNPSSRLMAIKEINRLCDEAIDHDTSWEMFCELVRRRMEVETSLMPDALIPDEGSKARALRVQALIKACSKDQQ